MPTVRAADEEKRVIFAHVSSRRNAFVLTRLTPNVSVLAEWSLLALSSIQMREFALLVSHGERQMNNKQSWYTSVPVFILLAPSVFRHSFVRARARTAGDRTRFSLASERAPNRGTCEEER